jgi:hypothetical protein
VAIIAESDWVLEFDDLAKYYGEAADTTQMTKIARTSEPSQSSTSDVDWSKRVHAMQAPATNDYVINDTLADLVRACNLAAKKRHGDLIFLCTEYNNSKQLWNNSAYPSNGTQAVAVTAQCAACLHHLLSDMNPAHIDKLLMRIGDENLLWTPFGSSSVYKPFGNSSTYESGCSVGKQWENFERPGQWGARYIALTVRSVERWVLKPTRKGQAVWLARCKFPEDNESAKWRTYVPEEGERPSFGVYVGDGGVVDLDYTPTSKAQKRKLRSMKLKASRRIYTTDAHEAAISVGPTHTHFTPNELTQAHFSQGYIHTPGLSSCLHTHTQTCYPFATHSGNVNILSLCSLRQM